jgi:hypothetical protein
MATQTTVINETTPGKSWSVYWDLRGIPARTIADTLTASATFTCGEKVYKVEFNLFENYLKEWNLLLDFLTIKGKHKLNDQVSEFKFQFLQMTKRNRIRW